VDLDVTRRGWTRSDPMILSATRWPYSLRLLPRSFKPSRCASTD
jgi:hypothetical protein